MDNFLTVGQLALLQPKFGGAVSRADFIAEALARAEYAGFLPAQFQREVDWSEVMAWATRVRQTGFTWADADDRTVDAILVGPGPDGYRAVHSGQHRILGGLMGDNPVPETSLTPLTVFDPTRGWLDPVPSVSLSDLLW